MALVDTVEGSKIFATYKPQQRSNIQSLLLGGEPNAEFIAQLSQ